MMCDFFFARITLILKYLIYYLILFIYFNETEGSQHRVRACNNPLPEGDGVSCDGDAAQMQACHVIYCRKSA